MYTEKENNGSAHITPIGGNIFSDLGFSAEDSVLLQTQSRAVIAERLKDSDTRAQLTCVDVVAVLDIKK